MASARPAHTLDLSSEHDRAVALRIGVAWKELRRGAAMGVLRDHLFGAGADYLEPGQVDTLELLVSRDGWRMSELAEALRVDPSTATRAVQRLVKAGLAQRRASRDDGRVVMVSATEAGRRRHATIAEIRWETMRRLLAEFDPDERAALAELLDRFVAALDDLAHDLDRHGS